MKHSPSIYAKAFAGLLDEQEAKGKAEPEKFVKNFVALIQKNGDERHANKIIEETEKELRKKYGVRKVLLESARPLTSVQLSSVKKVLKQSDDVREQINSELIAGMRITIDDTSQMDASLSRKLNKLFT